MNELPNQTLIAATGAALFGLAFAAGIIRLARWNTRMGSYAITPWKHVGG